MPWPPLNPLQFSAATLSNTNEALAFAQWIWSADGTTQRTKIFHLHPAITIITYAILEPVFYKLLFWSAIPPDYLLSASVLLHLHITLVVLKIVLQGVEDKEIDIDEVDTLQENHPQDEEKCPRLSKDQPIPSLHPTLRTLTALLIPTTLIAQTNASLLLFAQSLLLPSASLLDSWPRKTAQYSAVLTYLPTIYANVHIGILIGRPRTTQRIWRTTLSAMIFLLIKIIPRVFLDLEAFASVAAMEKNSMRAKVLGCEGRYAWFYELGVVSETSWLVPVWSFAMVVQGTGLWVHWIERRGEGGG